MNTRLGGRAKQRQLNESDIIQLTFESKRVAALADDLRYTYATMAHIFTELNILQKLAVSSRTREGAADFERTAQMVQQVLLIRTLAGKIFEASQALNAKEIRSCLVRHFFPLHGNLEGDWREMQRRVSKCGWLSRLRNSHAFHYPTFEQIGARLAKYWPADGGSIVGQLLGNTLFAEAEVAMTTAFFASTSVNDTDASGAIAAFRAAYDELIQLARSMTQVLFYAVQLFERHYLVDDKKTKPLGKITAPRIGDTVVSYYMQEPLRAT